MPFANKLKPLVLSLPWLCATSLVAPLFLSSCNSEDAPEREILAAQWDTVWQTQPGFQESILPSPSMMTFNEGILYIFDDGMSYLVALDGQTGALLWKAGRAGHGPGEFSAVSTIFPDQGGGAGVVDIGNRRVYIFNPRGQLVTQISLVEMGTQPAQVCNFGDAHFLVSDVWNPLYLVMDSMGRKVETLTSIWPDLDSTAIQTRVALWHNDGEGRGCFIGLGTGRGFTVIQPDSTPRYIPYIESFEVFGVGPRESEVKPEYGALRDAEFIDDEILVLFSGRTKNKNRYIDRYDRKTGRYLGTYLLPLVTFEMAAGDGLIFVTRSGEQIIALRVHE